jgi:hypothetical protein
VQGEDTASADVRDQIARVLSPDHDGNEFLTVGRRDPVVGRLQGFAALPASGRSTPRW